MRGCNTGGITLWLTCMWNDLRVRQLKCDNQGRTICSCTVLRQAGDCIFQGSNLIDVGSWGMQVTSLMCMGQGCSTGNITLWPHCMWNNLRVGRLRPTIYGYAVLRWAGDCIFQGSTSLMGEAGGHEWPP